MIHEDALIAALEFKTRTPRSGDHLRPPTKSARAMRVTHRLLDENTQLKDNSRVERGLGRTNPAARLASSAGRAATVA